MRTNNRILKIIKVEYPAINFVTNSGEYRDLDIQKHFSLLGINKGDFGNEILENQDLFKRVTLIDNALAWEDLQKQITLPGNQKFNAYFHLDPIESIRNSRINEYFTTFLNLGDLVRSIRKQLNLSQEELGKRIGSTKQYISKIENEKTDLELKTLRKLFEVGLNKNLFIAYYDQKDKLTSFTNSILKNNFLNWANENRNDLLLIEGIGPKTKQWFEDENIYNPDSLSKLQIKELFKILEKRRSIGFFRHPESWPLQAKYILSSDWINLIKLQRYLDGNADTKHSKIEKLAKEELQEEIYR